MVTSTVIWFLLMFLTWYLAEDYNRSVVGWLLLGFFLSPIVSVVGLLIVGGRNFNRY